MLKTPLCRQLGIEYPIFSVGMGINMAGPELVAAVSEAGGCGVLGSGGLPAPAMREQIRALRALTTKPFGVNIIMPMMQEGQVDVAIRAISHSHRFQVPTPDRRGRAPAILARRSAAGRK